MSHHAQGEAGTVGSPPLPESGGIAAGFKVLLVVGTLLVIMQGSFVAAASGFGRIWPAANSDKVELPPSTLK